MQPSAERWKCAYGPMAAVEQSASPRRNPHRFLLQMSQALLTAFSTANASPRYRPHWNAPARATAKLVCGAPKPDPLPPSHGPPCERIPTGKSHPGGRGSCRAARFAKKPGSPGASPSPLAPVARAARPRCIQGRLTHKVILSTAKALPSTKDRLAARVDPSLHSKSQRGPMPKMGFSPCGIGCHRQTRLGVPPSPTPSHIPTVPRANAYQL